MKKIIYFLLASLFLSCGSSKVVRNSKKVMKGNWVLTSVDYNTQNTLSVDLLNHASAKCYEGSTWQFIPNNNTGNYVINAPECTASTRNFIFIIQEVDATTGYYDFLLKPTNRKGKSETNAGYRLELASLSETNMQWVQTVSANGKPFPITMNFIKKQP